MSSNRHSVQLYLESLLGCDDSSAWTNYRASLEHLELNDGMIFNLDSHRMSDAISYYSKGMISLLYAIDGIKSNKFSWSIVKLYYSLFYFIRSEILLSNYILTRCKSLYYVNLFTDRRFQRFSTNAKGDHKQAIKFHNYLYNQGVLSDPLQGNKIEEISLYEWFMNQREHVNYKQKEYDDPNYSRIFENTVNYMSEGRIQELFTLYYEDAAYVYCYDVENCILAAPIMKARLIKEKITNTRTHFAVDSIVREHLKIGCQIEEDSILLNLL
jgi:hypothetical protein